MTSTDTPANDFTGYDHSCPPSRSARPQCSDHAVVRFSCDHTVLGASALYSRLTALEAPSKARQREFTTT